MIALHHASMLDWLAAYNGPLFDACVTDPPYHLTSIVKRFGGADAAPAKVGATGAYARASRGFMGKEWDGGDIAFRPETWRAVFDALKPGAHLAAFSGTRTYHRMACAIEDAGFEIRDQLAWAYGSGFPKSHDVSKGIDRMAGAERDCTRPGKVVIGGYGDDWAINSSADRPRFDQPATPEAAAWQGWGTALKPAWEPICLARKPLSEKSVAANVLRHGTGAINVDGCRVGTEKDVPASAKVAKPDGVTVSLPGKAGTSGFDPNCGRWPANLCHDGSEEVLAGFPETGESKSSNRGDMGHGPFSVIGGTGLNNGTNSQRGHDDAGGSAARFFYSAKAGPLDRIGSAHATVKPVDLMRWLCRLVTPPGGHILEPFAGSGTTGIAAMAEGFDCTMIELEAEHHADIARKLAYLRGEGALTFREHDRRRDAREADAGPLFGAMA